jgi:restriction system protein
MGAIITNISDFILQTSDIIGYKSGLALSIDDFVKLLEKEPNYKNFFKEPYERQVRIRSEEYEELIFVILNRLGVADEPYRKNVIPLLADPTEQSKAFQISEMFINFLGKIIEIEEGETTREIDPSPFLKDVLEKFGINGLKIAQGMLNSEIHNDKICPWSVDRVVEWNDKKELKELFESENLTTSHGTFFDQRFINFLHQNFERIDDINWRKFEGLTAEFLERVGFKVEIGPGRDDGNIDIRAWNENNNSELPPTVLVQCKRQKAKVEKVVVKALWADMKEESVGSGLIVTTSEVSPGARDVCKVRNYNIEEANRESLREWIELMRTPNTGINLLQI